MKKWTKLRIRNHEKSKILKLEISLIFDEFFGL